VHSAWACGQEYVRVQVEVEAAGARVPALAYAWAAADAAGLHGDEVVWSYARFCDELPAYLGHVAPAPGTPPTYAFFARR
jgi:hypothetical protein